MTKAVERKINKIYWTLFKKCFTNTTLAALSRGDRKPVKKKVLQLQSSKQFDDFAAKFSKELAKQGLLGTKGVWRKYYEAARASGHISLKTSFTEYEYNNMTAAIKHNFTMIKSIPSKFLEVLEHKYTSTLIEQVAKGSIGRRSFRTQLEKHGHKNAALIARTETAKLQTAILEERSTQLGSVAYIWLASNDRRTRPSHKNMNGVVVFWKHAKPELDGMTGHAGEFPNCRCSPQPIVDEDDLTKLTCRVYDYRAHRVITLSRQNLVEALKMGHL